MIFAKTVPEPEQFFVKTFWKSLMANVRNIWLADVLVQVVVRVLVVPKTTLDMLC